jgi:hypothetical protein
VKIGIVGRKGHGKDTAADTLVRIFKYERVAFADPIKEMLHVGLGISRDVLWGPDSVKNVDDPAWGVSVRRMMQTLGTEWGRTHVHPDLWIRLALDRHIPARERAGQEHFVVSDVRYVNEAEKLRDAGFHILKIVRPGYGDDTDLHTSETEVDAIQPNFLIRNEGTLDDLATAVIRYAEHRHAMSLGASCS